MSPQKPPHARTQPVRDASPAGTLARVRAARPSPAPPERRSADADPAAPAQTAELSVSALGRRSGTRTAVGHPG
ncbi:hypothetical protein [Streptomyces sp. NPDC052701]|uniref:hypothetical protein n=1 Tax=Streptomyces sp. NPDC052701 TaxID=3155533 RepID=UPI00342B1EFF